MKYDNWIYTSLRQTSLTELLMKQIEIKEYKSQSAVQSVQSQSDLQTRFVKQ